jgi:hypothetical protein
MSSTGSLHQIIISQSRACSSVARPAEFPDHLHPQAGSRTAKDLQSLLGGARHTRLVHASRCCRASRCGGPVRAHADCASNADCNRARLFQSQIALAIATDELGSFDLRVIGVKAANQNCWNRARSDDGDAPASGQRQRSSASMSNAFINLNEQSIEARPGGWY